MSPCGAEFAGRSDFDGSTQGANVDFNVADEGARSAFFRRDALFLSPRGAEFAGRSDFAGLMQDATVDFNDFNVADEGANVDFNDFNVVDEDARSAFLNRDALFLSPCGAEFAGRSDFAGLT